MRFVHAVVHALELAGSMSWEILWALILGFGLSAVVQAVVRRSTITRLLGDDRPKTLAIAAGLGAASSSCSYAAVALEKLPVERVDLQRGELPNQDLAEMRDQVVIDEAPCLSRRRRSPLG